MDALRRPLDPLGREIRRWLSQADGRLGEMDSGVSDLPRADDFGHVTAKSPDEAARATPRRSDLCVATAALDRLPSERHGIFVASGWGTRVRES